MPGYCIGLGDGSYEEHALTLRPGDRLYLYSDGLPDASGKEHQRMGVSRVLGALEQSRSVPLEESLDRLLREVEGWCGGVPPDDDISILAVERA